MPRFSILSNKFIFVPDTAKTARNRRTPVQEDTTFEANLGLPPSLAGKSVLIFGGTSGIGLATGVAAKASGAAVIVAGRDRDRAARVADTHGFAGSFAAEIGEPEAIRQSLSVIEQVDHL